MRSRTWLTTGPERIAAIVALLTLGSAASQADTQVIIISVPAPWACDVPGTIGACPAGDIAYTVVLRDAHLYPTQGRVVLDFSGCPDLKFCVPDGTTPYIVLSPTSVAVDANVQGEATFWLRAGSTCVSGVHVQAIPITGPPAIELADPLRNVASVDQDGDGVVTSADAALLASKGPSDPTADVSYNNVHDAADAALLAAHMGHSCPALVTPARRSSWGGLKIIYR